MSWPAGLLGCDGHSQARAPAGGKSDDVTVVPVEKVKVGQVVVVRAVETIPVDGVLIRGETTVGQSVLTGESLSVDIHAGDLIGSIRLRTARAAPPRATKERGIHVAEPDITDVIRTRTLRCVAVRNAR